MAHRHSISYASAFSADGKPKRSTCDYYLATTADCMQFYCFDEPKELGSEGTWTLIDRLDRSVLLAAGDKSTAKTWAERLGLRSWTYVRV